MAAPDKQNDVNGQHGEEGINDEKNTSAGVLERDSCELDSSAGVGKGNDLNESKAGNNDGRDGTGDGNEGVDGGKEESKKEGGTEGSGEDESFDEGGKEDELNKDNERNSDRDDERSDGDSGVGDNQDKKLTTKGGNEMIPRPSVNNLVKPESNQPTFQMFIKQLPINFQTILLQGQKKTKTRKRKRTTDVQIDDSNVFTNCVKTYQKSLNCKILEQNSYFSDGIKTLPTN